MSIETGVFRGSDPILKELRELAEGALHDRVADALEEGGEMIADEARRRVPLRSGALYDSIKLQKNRKKLYMRILCDYPRDKKDQKGRYYAFAVEFGTRKDKAQPFLLPAAAAKRAEITARIERALREAVP